MRKIISILFAVSLALSLTTAFAAPAQAQSTGDLLSIDDILKSPKVNDLYAVKMGAPFTRYAFGGKRVQNVLMMGLVRVVQVTPNHVTLVTQNTARPLLATVLDELKGDMHNVTWDEKEKVRLELNQLPRLYTEKKIIDVRRLSPSQMML